MCLGSSFQRLAGFYCTTGGLLKIGLKPRVLACCDLRIYPRVLITPVRGSNVAATETVRSNVSGPHHPCEG